MSFHQHRCVAWIGVLTLGLSGCAMSRESGQSSWPQLPSPWATLKAAEKPAQSSGTTAKANKSSSQTSPKTVAKKASKSKAASEESITLAILAGRNFERAGEYDKARKHYEELYKQNPENPQVAHRLGVVADVQRRHAEAEHYLLMALQHEPRNAEALADLGYCYFLQGQLAKAESALTKAVKLEPADARHRNNLGLVLGHMGRYDEALAHFRKAGSEADACYNLAFIFAAQERVAEAKNCFQMALNADPTHQPSREALTSFSEYENLPPHMRDAESLADGRVRWVPYVEGKSDASEIAPAAATAVTSRDASRVTRALHEESRGMLNRNMQSQRNEAPAP